jgi:hypothetical protein
MSGLVMTRFVVRRIHARSSRGREREPARVAELVLRQRFGREQE